MDSLHTLEQNNFSVDTSIYSSNLLNLKNNVIAEDFFSTIFADSSIFSYGDSNFFISKQFLNFFFRFDFFFDDELFFYKKIIFLKSLTQVVFFFLDCSSKDFRDFFNVNFLINLKLLMELTSVFLSPNKLGLSKFLEEDWFHHLKNFFTLDFFENLKRIYFFSENFLKSA